MFPSACSNSDLPLPLSSLGHFLLSSLEIASLCGHLNDARESSHVGSTSPLFVCVLSQLWNFSLLAAHDLVRRLDSPPLLSQDSTCEVLYSPFSCSLALSAFINAVLLKAQSFGSKPSQVAMATRRSKWDIVPNILRLLHVLQNISKWRSPFEIFF